MRLLLDTHVLLWYSLNDPQLSAKAQALVRDPGNEVLMSPASYWEIAIKVSIGKLLLHRPYENFIDLCLNQYGFAVLPIEPHHTSRLTALPHLPGHKDPFDRLLVAQALAEQVAIVSADSRLDAYPISRLWT